METELEHQVKLERELRAMLKAPHYPLGCGQQARHFSAVIRQLGHNINEPEPEPMAKPSKALLDSIKERNRVKRWNDNQKPDIASNSLT